METFVPKGSVHGPIVPEFILKKQITSGAKILYTLLCKHASEHDHCWPSHRKLAAEFSSSVSSVKRYMAELVKAKLVAVRHKQDSSSTYYMLRPDGLKEQQVNSTCPQSKLDYAKSNLNYVNTLRKKEENTNPPLPPATAPRKLPPAPRACRLGGVGASFHDFEKAWEAYPKKAAMGFARSAWLRLCRNGQLPPLDALLASIERFMSSESWQLENGRFIPQMSNWLRGQRWLDTLPPAEKKATRQQDEISALQKKHETLEAERKAESEKLRPQFEAFAARFKQPYPEAMAFGTWKHLRSVYRAPEPSDVPDGNALNIIAFLSFFKSACADAAYRAAHPTLVSPPQDVFKTERAAKFTFCGEISGDLPERLLPQREFLCTAV